MDHKKEVASCKKGNWRLLDKDFESKPIKRRGKIPFQQLKALLDTPMSSQLNNNYITAPTSSNLYIFRKLNNMDKAKLFKNECDNWTKLYHKMLKGLKAMINVQKQV